MQIVPLLAGVRRSSHTLASKTILGRQTQGQHLRSDHLRVSFRPTVVPGSRKFSIRVKTFAFLLRRSLKGEAGEMWGNCFKTFPCVSDSFLRAKTKFINLAGLDLSRLVISLIFFILSTICVFCKSYFNKYLQRLST
jgi:hypothetical protein